MIAMLRDKNTFRLPKLRGPDAKLGFRISRARLFLFPRNNLKFCLPVLFTQRTGYVDRASGSLLRMKG